MSTQTPRRAKKNGKQDEKSQWPFIRWIEGRQRWMVDARTATGGERTFHKTKDEAEGAAIIARTKRQNEGASAFDDTELARYGWTIQRAIAFAVEHLRTAGASVPIAEAVESLIAAKRGAGRKEAYLKNRLGNNLGKLAQHFAGSTIAGIGKLDLQSYLAQLPRAAGTKNSVRSDCVTLWSYAQSAGWVKENEAEKVDVFTEDLDEVEVLSPAQAEALMRASTDDVAAFHAIGLFAGLRTEEMERIDWTNIKLDEGHIEVTSRVAKRTRKRGRARRIVPILPNLRAWLEPVAKKSGPICGPNFRRRQTAAKDAAGFSDWPRNVLRHSFVSYRLAQTNNAAQTAMESGHREQTMYDNYVEIVTAKAAEKYFGIMPS